VYARNVGDRTLTFGVSGMLWRDNLVMYDRQTESWWAQANGVAIHGPLKSSKLTPVSSTMMTWKQWRSLHPDTLVLAKRRGGTTDQYESYHASSRIGVTGRTRMSGRIDPKARVLGFQVAGAATAVFLEKLRSSPVVTVEAAGRRVVVVGTPDHTTGRVFIAGDHEFELARTASDRIMMKDRKTGSEWDGYEGRATSGPLAGERLTDVPAYVAYWFSWHSFFPDTAIVR
jgi:hypothetical protein